MNPPKAVVELWPEVQIQHFLDVEYRKIVGAITTLTGNVDTAQEAVDEALARLLLKLRRGGSVDSMPAWVARVAMNHARSRWRRLRKESSIAEDWAERSTEDERDTRMAIHSALKRLPARQREAAVLFYLLDSTVEDVATALSMRPGTVKAHLSRARISLARALEPDL